MTLRRLYVLVTCLPAEAPLWAVLREAEEPQAGKGKPSVERLRKRAAELAEQRATQAHADFAERHASKLTEEG